MASTATTIPQVSPRPSTAPMATSTVDAVSKPIRSSTVRPM